MLSSLEHLRRHVPPLTLITVNMRNIVLALVLCGMCVESVTTNQTVLKPLSCSSKAKACTSPHMDCVDGLCQCRPYFDYIPEKNTCLKPFGAKCTHYEEPHKEELCNTNKFLACDDENTCSCHQEGDYLLVYDSYLEMCVAPPGHLCELIGFMSVKKGCAQKSTCVSDPNRIVDKEYFGICECLTGYKVKGDRCLPEIGFKCELDGDCEQDGMECSKEKCACKTGRTYSAKAHECRLIVGETCELARDDCTENAECIGDRKENMDWDWRCKCQLGYRENSTSGKCVQDKSGNCKNSTIFDDRRGRCSVKVGGRCDGWGINTCVSHAYCASSSQTCQCFDGYVSVDEDRKCEKGKIEVQETETTTMMPEKKILITRQSARTEKYVTSGSNLESNEFCSALHLMTFIITIKCYVISLIT